MRERHYVPWGEEGQDDTAMDIKMLAMDVAPHVGMSPDEYEELLYRLVGWQYATHEGRKATNG